MFGYNFRYSAGTTALSGDLDGYSHQNPIKQVESHYPQGRLAADGEDI
jgi:hypothetical protein